MTVRRLLGIVFVILGTWAMVPEPLTNRMREKDVEARSMDVTAGSQERTVFLRALGVIAMIAGLAILVASVRDRS